MYKLMIAVGILIVYDFFNEWEYDMLHLDMNSIHIKKRYWMKLNHKLSILGIKQFNIYSYLFLMVVVFTLTFIYIYHLSNLFVPSLVLATLTASMPYIYLDLKIQKNNQNLSIEVSKLISTLTRWAVVKDDIYYCFSKAVVQLNDPLKEYISDFLLQVRYSGHIHMAFDTLIQQTKHEMLRNLMINLQQATYCKGDLVELLERLEEESYLIYGEHERRKSETYFDKLAIYFSILTVLVMSVIVLVFNEKMQGFYLNTTMGHYMISVFSILFFLGVYFASQITTFNY